MIVDNTHVRLNVNLLSSIFSRSLSGVILDCRRPSVFRIPCRSLATDVEENLTVGFNALVFFLTVTP